MEQASEEIEARIKDDAALVIITKLDLGEYERAMVKAAREIQLPPLEDFEEEYIPLKDRFDIPEPDKNVGFTLVNNNTWVPSPLYEERERQRRRLARGSKHSIMWTR